jgi:hypothetical protein
MKQFEVGKIYQMSSACDSDCIWAYRVISRTTKTVLLQDVKTLDTRKCRISGKYSEQYEEEIVFPLGQYSMCPTLRAGR